jgi:threonine/homoserine/homoserine lactone efflux protein
VPGDCDWDDTAVDLIATLPAFIVAVVLISASPGPAMALILRRAALHGFRGAVPTVLGLELGIYLWALAAGAGLASLIAASEAAYAVLRIGGAIFLIVLGARAVREAWRMRGGSQGVDGQPLDAPARTPPPWPRPFAEGAVVMLANPKAAVFMIAFYPQFIPADQPLLASAAVLGAAQVAVETVLYLGLAAMVGRARGWFSRPTVRRRLEAVSGTVLVALGVRVAASSR